MIDIQQAMESGKWVIDYYQMASLKERGEIISITSKFGGLYGDIEKLWPAILKILPEYDTILWKIVPIIEFFRGKEKISSVPMSSDIFKFKARFILFKDGKSVGCIGQKQPVKTVEDWMESLA